MAVLTTKIDFSALVCVNMANPNGDPLDNNRPRNSYNGLGEISDVCIKRKIRNRLQDLGESIFVQSSDRSDDGCKSLSERASAVTKGIKSNEQYAELACKTWTDVRSFGQVFAFKSKESSGVSVGVRGPVSIHHASSISPVEIVSMQITKSVNGDPAEKKSSDTMGTKHMVRFGLYRIKGSINVQLAQKTGFTQEDADKIKECLRSLFENDSSAARPEGSLYVHRLYWWQHNCASGQYPSHKVHNALKVTCKEGVKTASSIDDYEITVEPLPGLSCEIIEGI